MAEYGIKRHIFNLLKMNEFKLLLFLNPKFIFKHVPSRDIDSYAPERQLYNANKVLEKQSVMQSRWTLEKLYKIGRKTRLRNRRKILV